MAAEIASLVKDLAGGLELRAATESDRGYLRQLFASSRGHLRQVPLPPAQVDGLIEQQYRLQQAHYARQWPDGTTLVIRLSGRAIGEITLDACDTALRIIDIAIEPAMQGKGYGTALLRALQAVAEKHKLPVRLSVDRQNRKAKKLYLALGFQVTGGSGTHESMLWTPSAPAVKMVLLPQQDGQRKPTKSCFIKTKY